MGSGFYGRGHSRKRKVGHLKQDWDGLIPVGKITHYLGDAVALVAETPGETWKKLKKRLK